MCSQEISKLSENPIVRQLMDEKNLKLEEIERIISDAVSFVMINSQKKHSIKRADLVKETFRKKNIFKYVFKILNEELESCFGMQLTLVPDKKIAQYILVNTLEIYDINFFEKTRKDYVLNGILIPVLSVIFMSGGEVKEGIIWNFLKTLGLDESDKDEIPLINCNVKQLLTQVWVKQLYLEYFAEENDFYFKWGFRSMCEVNKLQLLRFISYIYDGEEKPETWRERYEEALNSINKDDEEEEEVEEEVEEEEDENEETKEKEETNESEVEN